MTNMAKKDKSLDFGIRKKIDESRNYFLEEIKHNDLMSQMYNLSVFLILFLLSVDAFQLLHILYQLVFVGITSSAGGLKIFALAVGIKNCKSIIKKKKKRITVFLGKTKYCRNSNS